MATESNISQAPQDHDEWLDAETPRLRAILKSGAKSGGTSLSADQCSLLSDIMSAVNGIGPRYIEFVAYLASDREGKWLSLSELSRLAKLTQIRMEGRELDVCDKCGAKS